MSKKKVLLRGVFINRDTNGEGVLKVGTTLIRVSTVMGILYLAVFGCIVALSGCKNENEKRQAYFNAKVLEINKEYVDVRCIEAFNSGISVDEEFSVTKDVVSAEGVPELNVDDNIRVVFNGDVMESDPLQIGTVYAIYLLDENGEVIPNN